MTVFGRVETVATKATGRPKGRPAHQARSEGSILEVQLQADHAAIGTFVAGGADVGLVRRVGIG